MRPRILIVGVSDTGAYLARRLCDTWDVSVLDMSEEALASPLLSECQARHHGDATSAMVLRRSGAPECQTLVAATDSDETNLEVLKLARQQFGIEDLYAVLQRHEWEERYHELPDVEVIDHHQACAALLESRLEQRKVATNIGLGEGEIIEVEVLANSSVIGQRLADLHPRLWLVGAVYREGALIVPHGDTVIEQGDRVVLIGEPEVLGAIATHIGSGESEFPLHYGTSVVALDSPGLPDRLPELAYLMSNTAALTLKLLLPAGRKPGDALVRCCEEHDVPLRLVEAAGSSPLDLARRAALGDAGLLALEPQPLGLASRFGLSRSAMVKLIDRATSPVLVCRGSFPYRKVLLALAELPFHHEAAQLAIDLVRKLSAELVLGVVHQPTLVVGEQLRQEVEEERRRVEELCRLYHVELRVQVMEGNPIEEVLRASAGFDLLVLPYLRGRRSSLTRPDVGQNLIHRAPCSTMVMPCGDPPGE